MKKIILLTLLCTSLVQSNNQDAMHDYCNQQNKENALLLVSKCKHISDSIKTLIIAHLNEYDNFTNIVRAIKATCLTNNELNTIINELHGNPKGFAEFVEILRKRFGYSILDTLAKKFGNLVAKTYIEARNQLQNGLIHNDLEEVAKAIQNGANIETSFPATKGYYTPLRYAFAHKNVEMVRLLLKAGAEVNSYLIKNESSSSFDKLSSEEKKINQLLIEALKKQEFNQ